MPSLLSVRHLVLGMLVRNPMSGYDIKHVLKGMSWLIDTPSYGSVYTALHRLLDDGLVTLEVVPSKDKPPKKVYTIAESGRAALQEWLGQPAEENLSLRTFMMRLALAGQLSPEALLDQLERRRAHVAEQYSSAEHGAEALGTDGDMGQRLTQELILAMASAELGWLDQVLDRLSKPSQRTQVAGEVERGLGTTSA
jgi:PadR family transcriptional regulator AphA